MGIFKAAAGAVGGALAEQWLETVEPAKINNSVLATYGVLISRNDSRSSNTKGTADVISNGSVIHVPQNVYMLLVDGGKIIAATDEAGYYQVDNSRAPSMFFKSSENKKIEGYNNTGNESIERPGGFLNTLKDSWERFKFGGSTPGRQTVIYINKQEIPNIRFGTRNPVPYTDRVLIPGRVISCKVTSFGTYSLKIADPILFFSEVCNKTGKETMTKDDMGEQYLNEFLSAYTTSLAKLSLENIMVNDIPIKTDALGKYMAESLDEEWLSKRGFLIHSVGIASISLDEQTDKLLEQYNKDSLLLDPNSRAARMTGGLAAGLEAAGSNDGGSMIGFAGMSMGMNVAGNMGAMPNQQAPQHNQQQHNQQQHNQHNNNQSQSNSPMWKCSCGNRMTDSTTFCSKCGAKKPSQKVEENKDAWNCSCGNKVNNGVFCSKCGSKKPESNKWICSCGNETEDVFCSKCGNKKPVSNKWVCSCGNETEDVFCSKCGNKKEEQKDSNSGPAIYKCDKCGWAPLIATNPPKFCPKCGDAFGDEDKQAT